MYKTNFVGLSVYENENRINDIENSVKYSLLANENDVIDNNNFFCSKYSKYLILFLSLGLLVGIIYVLYIYFM